MDQYTSLADFRERAGYDIDGIWYPRVTAIVGIKAKPGLYRYYAGMPSWRAADEAKERSAEEGSRVHDAVEAILKGFKPVLDDVTTPVVEAFMAFMANAHVKPLLIEHRLVSRQHGYAGTVDVVADINGTVGVLDIKTGKSMYRDYGIQTAAYAAALREDAGLPRPETSWVLRLDRCQTCRSCGATLRTKGGRIRINGRGSRSCAHAWEPVMGKFEFREFGDHARDLHAFLAAKSLWEWEHSEYLALLNA